MEDALGANEANLTYTIEVVLILISMEDALGAAKNDGKISTKCMS